MRHKARARPASHLVLDVIAEVLFTQKHLSEIQALSGKETEWQTFCVCEFLAEKRMRWMVKAEGRWVSFKAWEEQS